MSDPVDLLERAASKLEEMASGFAAQDFWLRDTARADLSAGATVWAEHMGPVVAAPLAEWLRGQAAIYACDPYPRSGYLPGQELDSPSLRFARLILAA